MKRNYMKSMAALTVAAALTVGLGCNVFAAKDYSKLDPNSETTPTVDYPLPADYNQSMADYVKKLTMLSESEKQVLVQADKEAQPVYKELENVRNQIFDKTNAIVSEADVYGIERNELMAVHDDLWEKLWDNTKASDEKDVMKLIEASKALKASEKEILKNDQKKIDELNAKIATYYAKAEQACAELRAKEKTELEKLNKIQNKTNAIWEKVYKK